MSDIFDTLVTDRPNNDTYYNNTDLNRVETAAQEAADIITAEGYVTTIITETEWLMASKPSAEQMKRYLGNIHKIQTQFTAVPNVLLPNTMSGLTYIGANNIEKFLKEVPALVNSMKANYRRCGTFNCGVE